MSYKIIMVHPHKYEVLDITTIEELLVVVSTLDTLKTSLVMQHTNHYGAIYYTDLLTLLSEIPMSEFPLTLNEVSTWLTDIRFDGYRVSNPTKAYGNKIMTYRLSELLSITAQFCNINQPDNRSPLYIGQEQYHDIVLTPTDDTDLSNFLFVKDGKIYPTILFQNELYIENGAVGFTESNHLILDLNPVGGCSIYYTKDLVVTNHEEKYTTIQLPSGVTFTQIPFIVIEGSLYDLTNPNMFIINSNTFQLNHDFINTDTPGYRYEHLDISDPGYAIYRIHEMLTSNNSMFIIPNNKVYITKTTLTKLDENTYMHKCIDPRLSGIVMGAHQNSILPYKILTSKPHIENKMYTHIVKIRDLPKTLAVDELQLELDMRRYLDSPYTDNRKDIRFISVGI